MPLIVKKAPKKNHAVRIVVMILVGYLLFRIMSLKEMSDGKLTLEMISEAMNNLYKVWSPVVINRTTIGGAMFGALFTWMIFETYDDKQKKTMRDQTYGTAEWGDAQSKEVLQLKDKNPYNNQIFTNDIQISRNSRISKSNRNWFLLGRSGSGKSRYVYKPNILNANGSFAVTDPKGELLQDCGYSLLKKGYTIKVLNLDEKWKSNHYNPFMNIRQISDDEAEAMRMIDGFTDGKYEDASGNEVEKELFAEDDVLSLIHTVMHNMDSDTIESKTGDPFWEKAEQMFLSAIFYYIIDRYEDIDRNFENILELIREAQFDDKGNSPLGARFELWRQEDPNNIGIKQWDHFMQSAQSPKTMATIVLTASARLNPFNIKQVAEMTSVDDMELHRIGQPLDSPPDEHGNRTDGKICYFIITNPTDSTFNWLGAIFYSQLFKIMDASAKANHGSLATSVDLYLDEFAQIGEIPDFEKVIAYVRSLNIGCIVGVQSIDQLKSRYKDNWGTIIDCCDYTLFLGSNHVDSLEWMSKRLGNQTIHKTSSSRTYSRQGSTSKSDDEVQRALATPEELGSMPKGKCVLITPSMPFYSDTYDLTKHPDYNDLFESWIEDGNTDIAVNSKEWLENHKKAYNHLEHIVRSSAKIKRKMILESLGLEFLMPEETKPLHVLDENNPEDKFILDNLQPSPHATSEE